MLLFTQRRDQTTLLRQWSQNTHIKYLLTSEQQVLEQVLENYFGSYCLQFNPLTSLALPNAIRRHISLGAEVFNPDIICAEHAWPCHLDEADVVVLQHSLEFAKQPHDLLREAAKVVRPGGHLVLTGTASWSCWSVFQRYQLGILRSRIYNVRKLVEWLSVLGLVVEMKYYGAYLPHFAIKKEQQAHTAVRGKGFRPLAGFYVLSARKLVHGARLVKEPLLKSIRPLIPMPAQTRVGESHLEKKSSHE
ncbi:methyltransferase domain-containing protein [Pseudomonas sp. F1_0610]|uniref:methyltransferase domain-containing protein n=1 Tax=Pseudomonas sp. F1_0610 TaxID=3114284 RepID=UPI0039C223B7